jgi:precorrin-2/cobalt-factor-2 C20-methyltransferase
VTQLGVLYGVGAGPGAPDLLTLRALSVLRSADVLALPRSSDFGESVAWQIVREHCGNCDGQIRLKLTFPMSKDAATVAPQVARAVDAIGAHLTEGRSVAFVTEGDPSVYSTFGYVRDEARRRWPALAVQVIPGVTSITSVASVGGVALADGQERVAIVPATYGVDDLVDLFTRFDTVVLMKLGAELPAILAALERTELVDHAFFVSKATMTEERVVRDVKTLRGEHGGCFAMMIVKRGDRSGVLLGRGATSEAHP